MAPGALLIQIEYGFSDQEVVDQIWESPALQYFVGLPGYRDKAPFNASLMVHFRKWFTAAILDEINEKIIAFNQPEDTDDGNPPSDGNTPEGDTPQNKGTIMLDVTCAPSQIPYPQDTKLLNKCREKLEGIIDCICRRNHLKKPRTYRNKPITITSPWLNPKDRAENSLGTSGAIWATSKSTARKAIPSRTNKQVF